VHVAFMEEKTYAHRTLHVNRGEKSRGEIKINIKFIPKKQERKL